MTISSSSNFARTFIGNYSPEGKSFLIATTVDVYSVIENAGEKMVYAAFFSKFYYLSKVFVELTFCPSFKGNFSYEGSPEHPHLYKEGASSFWTFPEPFPLPEFDYINGFINEIAKGVECVEIHCFKSLDLEIEDSVYEYVMNFFLDELKKKFPLSSLKY